LMYSEKSAIGSPFTIFLAGQGLENLGESMRFIAVTTLIFKLTGSGISAAAGVALSALPGILASPFAGVLGDRAREGRLLVLIDIARFLTLPLFLYAGSIVHIYILLVLISVLDVFYNPSRKKYVLSITGREGALKANSLLTGAAGAAYLAGPILAGFLTDTQGPALSIVISSLCCLMSGFMTLASVISSGRNRTSLRSAYACKSTLSGLAEGLRYCLDTPGLWELLAAGIILGFCTISVNLAFYPYAFDIIKVTAKGWSLMITVYYGANLMAMFLTGYIDSRSGRNNVRSSRMIYACLCVVSLIWLIYTVIRNYAFILLLQFVEGTLISVAGIILAARYQIITGREYMARVTGLNDVLASAGKLVGMGCTAFIAGMFTFGGVFAFCSILLLVFSVAAGCSSGRAEKSRRTIESGRAIGIERGEGSGRFIGSGRTGGDGRDI